MTGVQSKVINIQKSLELSAADLFNYVWPINGHRVFKFLFNFVNHLKKFLVLTLSHDGGISKVTLSLMLKPVVTSHILVLKESLEIEQ